MINYNNNNLLMMLLYSDYAAEFDSDEDVKSNAA